jgi:hypothetical protein
VCEQRITAVKRFPASLQVCGMLKKYPLPFQNGVIICTIQAAKQDIVVIEKPVSHNEAESTRQSTFSVEKLPIKVAHQRFKFVGDFYTSSRKVLNLK